jgi:hypothetical protein
MLHDAHAGARLVSTPPDAVVVRASEPGTVDRASVVALGANGAVVGRATLLRLYGARGELALELAPSTVVALALIDAIEADARVRGLAQLELDAGQLPLAVVQALRRSRSIREEYRGKHRHLTWPTTNPW